MFAWSLSGLAWSWSSWPPAENYYLSDDELAAALVEILGLVNETKHGALVAAIRQAGIQKPSTKGEKPLLAAPSRHDLVLLLSALSAHTTYGVAGPATTKTPGDESNSPDAKFRREVAELRRTLQTRVETDEETALSPRFSHMAQHIISKEEQLQRMKEVLRNQRAANQKGLDRVQKHLAGLKGPKTEMHRVLQRMESEHMQAAQRWEYKRECLHEERKHLMEQAMKAFCKVVYVDRADKTRPENQIGPAYPQPVTVVGRASDHRTLVHGFAPGGDPDIVAPNGQNAPPPSRQQTVGLVGGL